MPLIVLEGPDGSGKSTLAARLLKGTGHPTLLIKRSGPPGDEETLVWQAAWIQRQGDSRLNIIADRHPLISEAIYKPVVRKQGPTDWDVDDAIVAFAGEDLLLIYCRPNLAALMTSVHVEEQMAGVKEYYGALVQEYDRWFIALDKAGIPIHWHDYTVDASCNTAIVLARQFWEKDRG